MMAGFRERGYMMRPMDDYLYGGLAGVAVFFAELAGRTGKAEHCHMRRILADACSSIRMACSRRKGRKSCPQEPIRGRRL